MFFQQEDTAAISKCVAKSINKLNNYPSTSKRPTKFLLFYTYISTNQLVFSYVVTYLKKKKNSQSWI